MALHAKELATQTKEAGNALFREKKYDAAIEKYTAAIALDKRNPIFYANRASCFLALEKYQEAIVDCKKSIEIDPHYPKSWLRLGDAYEGLTQYAESIEAYQQALTNPETSDAAIFHSRIRSVSAKIQDPGQYSLDLLFACASAHNISIPNKEDIKTRRDIENLRKFLHRHPKWGHEPRVRLLLIPDNEKQPIMNLELEKEDPTYYVAELKRILGCTLFDSVLLYSEDHMAYAQGKPNGVGLGRIHTSYEAYMDDSANSRRPPNRRASALLCRPGTHGPILVMKSKFMKFRADAFGQATNILGWETVTTQELKSDEFKRKRREWMQNQQKGVADLVEQGFQVLHL